MWTWIGHLRAIMFSHCHLWKVAWNLFPCPVCAKKLSYYLASQGNLHRFLSHFSHLGVKMADGSRTAVFLSFHGSWTPGYAARDYIAQPSLQWGSWLHYCQTNISEALNFHIWAFKHCLCASLCLFPLLIAGSCTGLWPGSKDADEDHIQGGWCNYKKETEALNDQWSRELAIGTFNKEICISQPLAW